MHQKWFLQIFILSIVLLGGIYSLGRQIPCKQVISYSIGSVDPRFGLETNEIQQALVQAEKPWEDVSNRDLFRFDQANPDITVNFIYDERQERTQALLKLNNEEENVNSKQTKIDTNYSSLKEEYEKKASTYERQAALYEERLRKYNIEVNQFNKNQNAGESDVKRLGKESESLEKENKELEALRVSLNTLANKLNALAKNAEQVVNSFNEKVEDFEERFQNNGVFDQGDYGGKDLNIYQFQTRADLQLVLAHEFGHSLGLDHVENPQSLMYYLMEQQSKEVVLTPEDRQAFLNLCSESNTFSLTNVVEIGRFIQSRLSGLNESISNE